MHRRDLLNALATASLYVTTHGLARAQSFPSKPIRIVVPFAPGGATDTLARAVAAQLTVLSGQTVFVENKPGASGAIAMEFVARAPADGYTLLWGSDTVVVQPLLNKSFPVDPFKDLTPLARLGTAPSVLSVRKDLGTNNIRDLVALAKSQPGRLKYGSGGNGSTQHFAGEEFKQRAGIDMIHVPYKGVSPAMADTIGGHIDMVLTGVGEVTSHVATGSIKALAVFSEARVEKLPGVPTMIESGYPGFISGSWMGMLGPANLPADVANWLSDKFVLAAQSDDFKTKTATFGVVGPALKGPETAAFMRALSDRLRQAAEKAGIKSDA